MRPRSTVIESGFDDVLGGIPRRRNYELGLSDKSCLISHSDNFVQCSILRTRVLGRCRKVTLIFGDLPCVPGFNR